MSESTVVDLVRDYVAGAPIDELARRFAVNRSTVIHHLDHRGVARRRSARKMTGSTVREAAAQYETGQSLKVVAARFDVDARTLAREFNQAGIAVRARRGWPIETRRVLE